MRARESQHHHILLQVSRPQKHANTERNDSSLKFWFQRITTRLRITSIVEIKFVQKYVVKFSFNFNKIIPVLGFEWNHFYKRIVTQHFYCSTARCIGMKIRYGHLHCMCIYLHVQNASVRSPVSALNAICAEFFHMHYRYYEWDKNAKSLTKHAFWNVVKSARKRLNKTFKS